MTLWLFGFLKFNKFSNPSVFLLWTGYVVPFWTVRIGFEVKHKSICVFKVLCDGILTL